MDPPQWPLCHTSSVAEFEGLCEWFQHYGPLLGPLNPRSRIIHNFEIHPYVERGWTKSQSQLESESVPRRRQTRAEHSGVGF